VALAASTPRSIETGATLPDRGEQVLTVKVGTCRSRGSPPVDNQSGRGLLVPANPA